MRCKAWAFMNYGPSYPFSSCHQNLQAMIVLHLLSAWSEKYGTWWWKKKWENLAKLFSITKKKNFLIEIIWDWRKNYTQYFCENKIFSGEQYFAREHELFCENAKALEHNVSSQYFFFHHHVRLRRKQCLLRIMKQGWTKLHVFQIIFHLGWLNN